jgi:RHS repeat-associated protein
MASKERAFTVSGGKITYGATLSAYKYQYDECNNLTKLTCSVAGSIWNTVYTYDSDNRPKTTTLNSGKVITNTYDAIGRFSKRTIGLSTPYETRFEYHLNGSNRTPLLHKYYNGSDDPFVYNYDDNGNITSITQGSTSITYEYDAANRLTRENNQVTNQTVTYEYDTWGNILNKKIYAYTTATSPGTPTSTITYTYGNNAWKDQLTSYNGQTITYDNMGNPTSYRGYTFGWRGKQLVNASDGTRTITFEYNEDGLRQKKTVNGLDTNYYYNGSVLIGMQRGTSKFLFSYDASGNVVSVKYNGTEYYYLRNAQGDIVKLIDASGVSVVEYTYDTWGKAVTTTGTLAGTLGLFQPFRYRGYVYDYETGFYYLQSRYYDPTTGRFISADVLLSTGQGVLGHNAYAYCLDNPVMMRDDRGGTSVSILFVEDSSTSYNNETEVYTTTITYTVLTSYEGLFFDISLNCSYSVSLQFTIGQDGIVHVSNDQKDMASIANPPVGIAFAHEILKTTKGINENFLAGRTADGIEFEMVVHYMAYLANPSQKNAKSTEIGSSEGSIGYDSNAKAFEQPIENRDIWFKMIKQYLKIE